MEISNTVCRIISELHKIGEELTKTIEGCSDKEWTKEIKERLAGIGRKKNYNVIGSGAQGTDWREWLFDLTWLEYDQYRSGYGKEWFENATLLSIPFAMESEWKKSWEDIKEDFEKLLVSDAHICLMIYQAVNGKKLNVIREKLQKRIKGYKASRKKIYILAGWNFNKRSFDIVRCKVTLRGKVISSSHSCKKST